MGNTASEGDYFAYRKHSAQRNSGKIKEEVCVRILTVVWQDSLNG